MTKGIYIRTTEHREKLREKINKQRLLDSRIGFKKGNNPKYKFKMGNKIGPRFQIGNIPKNKGVPNFNIRGENHWNWNGGNTKERTKIWHSIEYKLWREAVFERDNYTCIWCGQKGGQLNVDHIKPFAYYPELRFAIDNGRTLCIDCHKTTDTYGTKKGRVF